MGSYFSKTKKNKLCEDIIEDHEDFAITINIYTMKPLSFCEPDIIMDYLQYTNPVLTYSHNNSIHLLYRPDKKLPFLRSNISGEIISYLSSELTIFLVKNNIEPRMIDIHFLIEPYKTLLCNLKTTIIENKYHGKIQGIETLNEAKLNELT
jgi:hypothetical protein